LNTGLRIPFKQHSKENNSTSVDVSLLGVIKLFLIKLLLSHVLACSSSLVSEALFELVSFFLSESDPLKLIFLLFFNVNGNTKICDFKRNRKSGLKSFLFVLFVPCDQNISFLKVKMSQSCSMDFVNACHDLKHDAKG
jgi:hypothetical protein